MNIGKKHELYHTWITTSKITVKQCARCKVFKKQFYDSKNKRQNTGYCWSIADETPFATTYDCKP